MDSGGGDGPGQAQWKAEADKNRDTNSQLRVMEKFRELFNPNCCEFHLCPMSPDGREIYI